MSMGCSGALKGCLHLTGEEDMCIPWHTTVLMAAVWYWTCILVGVHLWKRVCVVVWNAETVGYWRCMIYDILHEKYNNLFTNLWCMNCWNISCDSVIPEVWNWICDTWWSVIYLSYKACDLCYTGWCSLVACTDLPCEKGNVHPSV